MTNSVNSVKNPMLQACTAIKSVTAQKRWINKQKVMCWKCQKDKFQHEGSFSFLVRRNGKLTAENAPRKFICFACKPADTSIQPNSK